MKSKRSHLTANPEPQMPQALAVFATKESAEEWMEKKVDDACIDNHRFAFLDDPEAMQKYQAQKAEGCCGGFDEEIIVAGRRATIGCNYGH